jgi:hexosaminidase
VAELVRYAAQYHVTILPEQEAFGHLHHVLKYDLYEDVAETPHGHVLAPGQPESAADQGLVWRDRKEFPSPFMHIGADETDDLGAWTHQGCGQAAGLWAGVCAVPDADSRCAGAAAQAAALLGRYWRADPKAVAKLPKDMIAVPWNYGDTKGFDKMIEPFAKAGIETWVAPGDANWSLVYPDANVAFGNIQGFIRDGQRLGSTGALITVWNDDGEGLFNQDWYGVLFGAVAAWQPGESSIPAYQAAYGPVFHGDPSGKINQAQQELMLANQTLGKAKTDFNSDDLFWMDPWSAEGQAIGRSCCRWPKELRFMPSRRLCCWSRRALPIRAARAGCAGGRWIWARGGWT